MTTMDRASYETGSAKVGLLSLVGGALRLARHAMTMRHERAALRAMPDYLLKDLGIGRSEIDHYTSVRFQSDRMDAGA